MPSANSKNRNDLSAFYLRLTGVFIAGALALALAFIILSGAILAAVIYLPTISFPKDYTVTTLKAGELSRRKTTYTLSEKNAVHGGEKYLNFTLLADKLAFPVSGDLHALKYKIPSSGNESGTFSVDIDNSRVTVNGVPVSVKNGVYYRNGYLYLPCTLVDECFNGITVECEEEKIRIEYEEMITLCFAEDNGNPAIDIPDLP